MFQSFFNGMAGMIVFSKGLDTISNNVTNLNTPGYRGSDVFYRSLGGDSGGSRVAGEYTRLSSGDIRETGNETDLAIIGNGQFVIEVDGRTLYTRGGQFIFDEDGQLVDAVSGGAVMALNESGQLVKINIDDLRSLPPEATETINLSGNLSTGDDEHQIEDVVVFNTLGEEVTLTLNFTNNTATNPGEWLIEVQDANGIAIYDGAVTFGIDGTPQAGSELVAVTIPATSNGVAGAAQTINLNLGSPGSFSESTSFSGGTVSTLQADSDGGRGQEELVAVSINDEGTVSLLYSNGDTEEPFRLALANISDEQALEVAQDGLYRLKDDSLLTYGFASSGRLGTIQSESLESANVDLVREFAEMIIAQRGYQASSQVLSISNELVDTLYNATQR